MDDIKMKQEVPWCFFASNSKFTLHVHKRNLQPSSGAPEHNNVHGCTKLLCFGLPSRCAWWGNNIIVPVIG